MKAPSSNLDLERLARDIRAWGGELGFSGIGIADTDLGESEARLLAWLGAGRHGEMDYMARHGTRRARPAELVPGTIRVISARLDYLPDARDPFAGCWALPGGSLAAEETLEESMRRHLAEKVDVRNVAHLEQLETLSDPSRNPTKRELATAYLG